MIFVEYKLLGFCDKKTFHNHLVSGKHHKNQNKSMVEAFFKYF